jgi:hypothetical protein
MGCFLKKLSDKASIEFVGFIVSVVSLDPIDSIDPKNPIDNTGF